MFTIRKQSDRRHGRVFPDCFRGIACIVVFVCATTSFAQFGIEENGYLFMHPYFEGTAWNATYDISNVLPAIDMCLDKPVNATAGKRSAGGMFVYTTTDGTLKMINGSFEENDCPCCRPSVLFDSPTDVALPAGIDVQFTLPFYLVGRGSQEVETAYLCIVGSDNNIYCLHISTGSGAVETVDTIPLSDLGSSELTGVWGEAAPDETDTAIWIGGTGGLLVRVPFEDNAWGTPVALTVDSDETVTAVGGGYVGMASGAVYRRSGDSLVATGVTADGALRNVGAQVAVGDNGTVLVNREGAWEAHVSGSNDYRLGNLTANGSGAVVELVDAQWNYSTLQLYDTPTDIERVTQEAMVGLNVGIYDFNGGGISNIEVTLRDDDGNRSMPSVWHKRGSTIMSQDTGDDGTILLQQTPTAICSTEQAFFDDSLLTLVLQSSSVQVEAKARRGTFDGSCSFWDWDYFTYSSTREWKKYDTLFVAAGGDTLRILNVDTLVTTNSFLRRQVIAHTRVICNGLTIRVFPAGRSELRSVLVVDAAGRCVWRNAGNVPTGTVLCSPHLPSGIHLLRIEYVDGTTEIQRLVLVGR